MFGEVYATPHPVMNERQTHEAVMHSVEGSA